LFSASLAFQNCPCGISCGSFLTNEISPDSLKPNGIQFHYLQQSTMAKNGFDLIIEDHRRVDKLFDLLKGSSDLNDQRKYLNEIIKELSVHAVLEEQVLQLHI
jgi:hypothetical protein